MAEKPSLAFDLRITRRTVIFYDVGKRFLVIFGLSLCKDAHFLIR